MAEFVDILIVGAGITGCAAARELSRFRASVLVLDRGSDLAEGATKANSGIVHAGYDALPGTKKAMYNVRGSAMYAELCASLGVPYTAGLRGCADGDPYAHTDALQSAGLPGAVRAVCAGVQGFCRGFICQQLL